MQETRNNCFGSKIYSMTLRQAKIGKHECRNITSTCCCFCLTKGRATYFRPKTIVASFLHFMVLLSKVLLNRILNHSLTLQERKEYKEIFLNIIKRNVNQIPLTPFILVPYIEMHIYAPQSVYNYKIILFQSLF